MNCANKLKYTGKSVVALLLAVLLLLGVFPSFAITASAEEAHGTITVAPGDTVDIEVSLTNAPEAYRRIMFVVLFEDTQYLYNNNTHSGYIKGVNTDNVNDASNVTVNENLPAFLKTMSTAILTKSNTGIGAGGRFQFGNTTDSAGTNYTGKIFTLHIKIEENAPEGEYPVYVSLNRNASGVQASAVQSPSNQSVGLAFNEYVSSSVTKIIVSNDAGSGGTSDPEPVGINVSSGYGGDHSYSAETGYTFTPITGYKLDVIYVDGVAHDATNVFGKTTYVLDTSTEAFADVKSIVATYAYTVNFLNPANGTLSVSRGGIPLTSGDIVRADETLTITASPNANYALQSLTATGFTQVGETNQYTVTAARTVIPTVAATLELAATAATPTITTQPISANYYQNATATALSVAATVSDGGTLSYQWYRGTSTVISGATAATYMPPTSAIGTIEYFCRVTNTKDGAAASTDSNKATIVVTADPTQKYNITLSGSGYTYSIKSGDDSIDLTGQTPQTHNTAAKAGETVTFTIAMNADYAFSAVSVRSSSNTSTYQATNLGNGRYSFVMPATDVTISVTTIRSYNITVNGSNFTYTISGNTLGDITDSKKAPSQEYITLKITPDPGYSLAGVNKSGGGQSPTLSLTNKTYSIIMTSADITINVTMTDAKNILVTGTPNGTVTLRSPLPSDFSSGTVYFDVVPDAGYRVKMFYTSTDENDWKPTTSPSVTIAANSASVTYFKAEFVEDDLTREISTEAELREFALYVNELAPTSGDVRIGYNVKLTSDIVLTQPWGELTIGTKANPFKGIFDGNGHTISGLNITRNKPGGNTDKGSVIGGSEPQVLLGLFGSISNATIKGLTVEGSITLTASDHNFNFYQNEVYTDPVGGIVTYASSSNIINCVSRVNFTGDGAEYGGIVYSAGNTNISGCLNYGDITVQQKTLYVGGIVGNLAGGTIENCGNYGNIDIAAINSHRFNYETPVTMQLAVGTAGGIVGYANAGNSNVNGSFNKGSISGGALNMGGIVGHTQTGIHNITDCYNTGDITSTVNMSTNYASYISVSGIAGMAQVNQTNIKNCYNKGALSVAENYGRSLQDDFCVGYHYQTSANTSYSDAAINCKRANETFTAFNLGTAYKDDTNNINGGFPLLTWEQSNGDASTHALTFNITPTNVNATVKVFSDSTRQTPVDYASGVTSGTYYYTVTADGYVAVEGSTSVYASRTVAITLQKVATVTFTVTPADIGATATVTISGFTAQKNNNVFTFELVDGEQYTAHISAPGYNGDVKEFRASSTNIPVALTKSEHSENTDTSKEIFGDGNISKTHTILTDGTYFVGAGATGTLTINAKDVTLIGMGATSAYENLYIKLTQPNSTLTIKDIYIDNYLQDAANKGNVIDFAGGNNTLVFAGTSIIDMDTNASGFAAIHVRANSTLEIYGSGRDTLYIYKSEQGAGIGGDMNERNGNIIIRDGNLFIKGSKQGALIGAGANASGTPGDITINGGSINLIAVARGAAIGGSAGSGGASPGSTVHMYAGTLNINVDFSGAAIGGGGYAGGNDADGGTLIYHGGSIRTYINENAVASWNVPAGVNDIAITADKKDKDGKDLYLFVLDTSKISGNRFDVVADGKNVYNGGLHQYGYVNETLPKTAQIGVQYTMNNWTYNNDQHLYLYLQGKNQTVTITPDGNIRNRATIELKWDEQTEKFTVVGTDADADKPANTPSGVDNSEITREFGDENIPLSGNPDLVVTITPDADTDDKGAATSAVTKKEVADAVKKAITDEKSGIAIAPIFESDDDVKRVAIEIPTISVKEISDAKLSLVINTPFVDLTFEGGALVALVTGAGSNETIEIIVEAVETGKLQPTQKGAVDGDRPAYELTVKSGGVIISSFGTGRVIVTIPYELKNGELAEGLRVFHVAADGTRTEIPSTYNHSISSVIFVVTHFSLYTIEYDASAVWSNPFSDVKDTDWFYDAVKFVSSQGLMNGTGADKFAPTANLTRAMLVTILYRAEGEPTVSGNGGFTDVPSGQWYTDAIAWAATNGIVNGVGDEKFDPNGNITREQLATILHRYTSLKGGNVTTTTDLASYTDATEISTWATEAMKWANASGLITGRSATTLAPKGTATRAEVATILMRYIQK